MEHHDQELIIRVLCPYDKIGCVIGKGENSIKSVREASGVHVEIDDTKTNQIIKKMRLTVNLMTNWHHLVICCSLHVDYELDSRDMNNFECCWPENSFEACSVYWRSCNS